MTLPSNIAAKMDSVVSGFGAAIGLGMLCWAWAMHTTVEMDTTQTGTTIRAMILNTKKSIGLLSTGLCTSCYLRRALQVASQNAPGSSH